MDQFGLFPVKGRYSQYGQANMIKDVLCRGKGYYVDIGARCGRVISNTFELERAGWDGLCVEPHPQLFSELRSNRSCKAFNCGASSAPGKLQFVMFLEEPFGNSGLLQSFRNPERLAKVKHEIIDVEVRTVTDILLEANAPPVIDYLDIDVEGHELNVLQGVDFSKHKFNFIGVETNPNVGSFPAIQAYLAENGYHPLMKLGSDTFFTPLLGGS